MVIHTPIENPSQTDSKNIVLKILVSDSDEKKWKNEKKSKDEKKSKKMKKNEKDEKKSKNRSNNLNKIDSKSPWQVKIKL